MGEEGPDGRPSPFQLQLEEVRDVLSLRLDALARHVEQGVELRLNSLVRQVEEQQRREGSASVEARLSALEQRAADQDARLLDSTRAAAKSAEQLAEFAERLRRVNLESKADDASSSVRHFRQQLQNLERRQDRCDYEVHQLMQFSRLMDTKMESLDYREQRATDAAEGSHQLRLQEQPQQQLFITQQTDQQQIGQHQHEQQLDSQQFSQYQLVQQQAQAHHAGRHAAETCGGMPQPQLMPSSSLAHSYPCADAMGSRPPPPRAAGRRSRPGSAMASVGRREGAPMGPKSARTIAASAAVAARAEMPSSLDAVPLSDSCKKSIETPSSCMIGVGRIGSVKPGCAGTNAAAARAGPRLCRPTSARARYAGTR